MKFAISHEEMQDHYRQRVEWYDARLTEYTKRCSELSGGALDTIKMAMDRCRTMIRRMQFALDHIPKDAVFYLDVSELEYWEFLWTD